MISSYGKSCSKELRCDEKEKDRKNGEELTSSPSGRAVHSIASEVDFPVEDRTGDGRHKPAQQRVFEGDGEGDAERVKEYSRLCPVRIWYGSITIQETDKPNRFDNRNRAIVKYNSLTETEFVVIFRLFIECLIFGVI